MYQLPAGVSLDQPLLGYNVEDPQDCDDKFAKEAKGSGGAVSLCLIFRNTTRRPVIVDLPPGLLVVSKDGNVQNGILAQRTSIEVPPGERYFAPLFLYCVNQDRRTSGIGDEYDLGPVVGYDAFQELYALLEGKVLTRQAVTPIQLAITHLSNNEGLTDEDRAALRAL